MTFRIIPRVENNASIVEAATRLPGKTVLLMLFAFELCIYNFIFPFSWLHIVAILALITLFPAHRAWLVLAGTLSYFFVNNPIPWRRLETVDPTGILVSEQGSLTMPAMLCVVAVFLFFAVYLRVVKKWHKIITRPITTIVLLYLSVLTFASYAPLGAEVSVYVWGFAVVLSNYLWFFAYTLLDARSKKTSPFYLQIGHYSPFWGSSSVPYPKGAAYLRKIEAKNDEQFAKSQLKAIKLLTWVLILVITQKLFGSLVHADDTKLTRLITQFYGGTLSLQIPELKVTKAAFMDSQPFSPLLSTLSVMASFFNYLLTLCVFGGLVISVARMAGYNALRNTYNPLFASSIADFWNRFYYYFKELLVDVFFYPSYLRYFRNRPRLRLFVATMSAACFGNFLFHFVRDIHFSAEFGIIHAFLNYHVYLFYCIVLGVSIGISQIRNESKNNKEISFFQKVKTFFVIVAFFCIVHTFDQTDPSWNLLDHFRFIKSLFII